jgi:hypothetical protein
MRFCCRAFEYWHGMAGTRGFGAFAAEMQGAAATFIIQHRALDSDGNPPAFTASPLSLVSDLVIQFCPWCGVKLDEFYLSVEQISRTDLKLL